MKPSLIAIAILAASGARGDIVSAFDTGNEGWIAADISPFDLSILSAAPAGWASGHLQATEFGSGLFALSAPAAYLGNLSGFYGGSVSYTLSDTVRDGGSYINLLLRGNGFAMAYVTVPPSDFPGTTYAIPLTEAGWIDLSGNAVTKTQFLGALSNLDRFGINADWRTGFQDVVTLDDVRVAPAPEPATFAALGLGFFALVRRRRNP